MTTITRALLLCSWLLAGCVAKTVPITLRHTDGRVVQCGPYLAEAFVATASAIREGQCIQDFQRQGFERVPE